VGGPKGQDEKPWAAVAFSFHNLQAANMFNSCTMSAVLSSSWLGYISWLQEVDVEVETPLDKSQLRQSFWLPSALQEFLKGSNGDGQGVTHINLQKILKAS